MKLQTVITQKRRGPAPTGKGTLIGVRLLKEPLAAIDAWVVRQGEPLPSRPEAIRRLVELGLTVERPRAPDNGAGKAAELAGSQIDKMADPAASPEDRQSRKRRLVRGPKEFRDTRKDHPPSKE